MLQTLKDLFDSLVAPSAAAPQENAEHALQLATAVLLVEVMRSEPGIAEEERAVILGALREKFSLAADEVDRLVELAEETSRSATDYFRFTSRINAGFNQGQKVRMIEYMWKVAYADGHLSAHENHVMRKVADLLHISRGDYVAAKMRARPAGAD